jgi:hypothetical protein
MRSPIISTRVSPETLEILNEIRSIDPTVTVRKILEEAVRKLHSDFPSTLVMYNPPLECSTSVMYFEKRVAV